MSRQQYPWQGLATSRERWAYRALVVILAVWTLAVGAGLLGFIVGKLQGA